MRYLLDTHACIALLNGRPPSLVDRVRRHTSSEFGLPAPVAYELYYGAFKSRYTDRNLGLLDRIAFEVVPFDAADARAAGAVRANLEALGRPIGPIDTLIAGQALTRSLVLVTANTQEFVRVEGLNCEDWSIPDQGQHRRGDKR